MRKHPNSHREAKAHCACSRLYAPFQCGRLAQPKPLNYSSGHSPCMDHPTSEKSEMGE